MERQPFETVPRDGSIVLLTRGSMIFPAYYGRAQRVTPAGSSKAFPWVVLDPTNGVNHVNEHWADGWYALPGKQPV